MDVNLPFLGSGGSYVESLTLFSNVDVLLARVEVPTNLSTFEHRDPIGSGFSINATSTESNIVEGDVFSGDIAILGNTYEGPASINATMPSDIYEINVDVDIAVLGKATENIISQASDIVVQTNADVHYYDLSYSMLNLFAISQSAPFFAGKIIARTSHIDSFNMLAESNEFGDVVINGDVIQGGDLASVDINVPVTTLANGYIENLNMLGGVSILDYVAVSPLTTYAVSISIPISMTGNAMSGSQPEFSIEAAINSVDVMLTADVLSEDVLRYEIADIDHGLADGKIKIFPNQWTMCFANKPVNGDGTNATITSFLLNELMAIYGSDIHTKISMIIAKHPETGEEYNFVVQDGYITPEGSMNDFSMCYLKDGAFYPIPFMVQSVSDEVMEIEWEV